MKVNLLLTGGAGYIGINVALLLIDKSHSVIVVAKMFNSKIKLLPVRKGERNVSALTNMNLSNKVYKIFVKINLINYVENIVKNNKKAYKSLFTMFLF